MKQFRVAGAANRRAQAVEKELEAATLVELAAWLPPGHYPNISELGPGTGAMAAHFFEGNPPTHYRAFESAPSLMPLFRAPETSPGQVTLSAFDPAQGLPLPDRSQDLLLTRHYLEYLRMDELYMCSHEARRVVKPGGLWALAGLCLPDNFLHGWWQKLRHPGQPLDLIHYISPEDWLTKKEKRLRVGGLNGQVVLLERVAPGP